MNVQLHPRDREPVLLSVVVPFLNEAKNMEKLINTLDLVIGELNQPWELILIDDGSQDDSAQTAAKNLKQRPHINAVLLSLSRNFGKEAAMTAGLEAASGEVVVPLDADLQDPPELIEKMLSQWKAGYDVVYAVRTRRDGDDWTKRLTAFLFYRIIGMVSNTPIPADTGDFRLMDRSVINAMQQLPERTRFMKGLFAWVGFKQTAIRYERKARHKGESNWGIFKLWNFALDGVTSFSQVPLQLIGGGGVSIALIAFGYGIWIIARTMIFGIDLPGYASVITIVLFLGGLQMMSIGVIGEYLGRVFLEVKSRPLYIIRKREDFRAKGEG